MLVLTRKVGEEIVLPDQGITIAVVRIAGNRVRLGIAAPKDVAVLRRELEGAVGPDGEEADMDEPFPAEQTGASLESHLRTWIEKRSGGRVRSLRIETLGDRTIIHVEATSYYGRQLAYAALYQALQGPNGKLDGVELDLRVAPCSTPPVIGPDDGPRAKRGPRRDQ